MPNNQVHGAWERVISVPVSSKYINIGYYDPQGYKSVDLQHEAPNTLLTYAPSETYKAYRLKPRTKKRIMP